MKTYLFGLLPLLLPPLPPLPLPSSLLHGCPSQNETKNEFWFVSPPIYSLNFPLINIWSSISPQLHFNFCYFYFGILSSLIMPFMSHLINYDFTLVLVQHSGFINLSLHNFILITTPKNITMTLGAYVPLRLLVPCTFSGWGVTIYLSNISELISSSILV